MATTKITSPDLFDLGSLNSALKLPSGTTAERPTSPSTGEWRYNTTTYYVEFWDGGEWRDLQSEDIPPIPSENFNTVLYDGNGSTNNITGVGFQPDLVWIKQRDTAVENHNWYDSTRGVRNFIVSNSTAANVLGSAQRLNAFGADGFTVGSDNEINDSSSKYVAWCWKANGGTTSSNTDGTQTSTVQVNAKAGFSIVQYTASAAGASETVGHGLGTTPAMIILKRTDSTEDWYVWHKDLGAGSSALNQFLKLNSTSPQATATNLFRTVNSTVFNPSYTNGVPNTNIAYCFAEKAEYSKFGSYIGNGSTNGPIENTGFEPAYIMIKNSTSTYEWTVYDNKRSTSNPRNNVLYPNTTGEENSGETGDIDFLTNGFQLKAPNGTINHNGGTMIYAAFAADASSTAPALADSFANKLYAGTNAAQSISGLGFQPSFIWFKNRTGTNSHALFDSVRGNLSSIYSDLTSAANISSAGEDLTSFDSDGFSVGTVANAGSTNVSGGSIVAWNWKANSNPTINTDGTIQSTVTANQAAGFSIVSYTATGSTATVGHGLGAAPDLIISKTTNQTWDWIVYSSVLGSSTQLSINSNAAAQTGSSIMNSTDPTSSVYTVGAGNNLNYQNGDTLIAYCFKSTAGFSKMGSYSGSGSAGNAQNVGFTPAWVMIKRTNSISDWYMFDTARGDTSVLLANSSAAQFTNTNFNLTSTGFDFDGTDFNEAGSSWIYMAFKENPAQYAIPSGEMGYLVAAGGGSGYYSLGAGGVGGGGAGGFRTTYGLTSGGGASAETNLTLATGVYTVTVGAGGAMVGGAGNDGSDSSITGVPSITTVGGGGGAAGNAAGAAGGSGSGAGELNSGTSLAGGAGTANQGFTGGTSVVNSNGGGGGGAASVGGNNGANLAGNGGVGITSAITGSNVGYAGGGGGSAYQTSSTGGLGTHGGGSGTLNGIRTTAEAGDINSGGGGGALGGSIGANGYTTGGSGIVVLRMNTSDFSGTTSGSPTISAIGSETILQYLASGSYVHNPSTAAGQMNYAVLAGGASGGSNGGGGGAGGFRSSWYGSGGGAAAETPFTLSSGTYTITIGAGGAETTVYQNAGNNGTATTISGNATVNTVGGGGGGSNNNPPLTGGSGGGSGSGSGGGTQAAGTAGEGFAGGIGMAATHPYLAGGGGGTGAVGGPGNLGVPGAGGNGTTISITGTAVSYGGGGGGTGGTGVGYTGPGGAGGTGGGGAGGAYNTTGIAGTANTGGGGGGSGDNTGVGGAGGSGKVILRLITSEYSGTTTGSPTVTTVGTETVLTFTGSGTYVHS